MIKFYLPVLTIFSHFAWACEIENETLPPESHTYNFTIPCGNKTLEFRQIDLSQINPEDQSAYIQVFGSKHNLQDQFGTAVGLIVYLRYCLWSDEDKFKSLEEHFTEERKKLEEKVNVPTDLPTQILWLMSDQKSPENVTGFLNLSLCENPADSESYGYNLGMGFAESGQAQEILPQIAKPVIQSLSKDENAIKSKVVVKDALGSIQFMQDGMKTQHWVNDLGEKTEEIKFGPLYTKHITSHTYVIDLTKVEATANQ